jgi:N-glycosylase/DNA lyase
MKQRKRTYARVEELRAEFDTRRDAIRKRLSEFASISPEDYFYELVYCLLTPQSSAVNAGKAVDTLIKADFFHNHLDVAALLHQDAFYIRFHHTKAKHLNEAKRKFPEIQSHLLNGTPSAQLREWLVHNVKGLGWKEASHFLRNIGHRNLAILDRHILRNLKRHDVLRTLPRTLTTKRYLTIERQFARFADTIGITMDELDLLFWSHETGEILK